MNFSRLAAPLAATASGLLLFTGCAALTEEEAGAGSGDSRTIAAAFYPLEYVAGRVAGDVLDVENLTSPGGEPHDLTLGVRESAVVDDAALLVYVDSLQPAVDEAVEESSAGEVLDAASVADLLPFAADGGASDDGELDLHFWHDPLRMASVGDAVAERLAEIVPEGADSFRANAQALRADLEELDAAYASGLADCATSTVVTNHDAFGYLEKYGLDLEPIAGISPDAEPTPAALARLQRIIEDEDVTTVFSESLVSPKTAQTLADDAGVSTDVLDTLEGLTEETADEDYLSLMRANLAALQEANGC